MNSSKRKMDIAIAKVRQYTDRLQWCDRCNAYQPEETYWVSGAGHMCEHHIQKGDRVFTCIGACERGYGVDCYQGGFCVDGEYFAAKVLERRKEVEG